MNKKKALGENPKKGQSRAVMEIFKGALSRPSKETTKKSPIPLEGPQNANSHLRTKDLSKDFILRI